MKLVKPIVVFSAIILSSSALAANGDKSMVEYPVGFGVKPVASALSRAEVRTQLTFEHAEATRGEMPDYPLNVAGDKPQSSRTRAHVRQALAAAIAHPAYQNVETDYPGAF